MPEQSFVVNLRGNKSSANDCLPPERSFPYTDSMRATGLTPRQREILECIEISIRDRGFPPSVREIGEAVGLNSPSTVHNHLEIGRAHV